MATSLTVREGDSEISLYELRSNVSSSSDHEWVRQTALVLLDAVEQFHENEERLRARITQYQAVGSMRAVPTVRVQLEPVAAVAAVGSPPPLEVRLTLADSVRLADTTSTSTVAYDKAGKVVGTTTTKTSQAEA